MAYELTGLEGKVAVVTGAGRMRSIGRPIAVELARAGCDIVLTGTGRAPERYPDDEKQAGWRDIASVAEEVEALGRRALPLISDVADLGAVERLAAQVQDAFGRVDIVVNNAGAARGDDRKPVVDLDVDLWKQVIGVNLTGTFLMSKVFGAALDRRGPGRRRSSTSPPSPASGSRPTPRPTPSSKAGIQALTACMAQEVGPVRGPGERRVPRDHRHVPDGRPRPGRGLGPDDRRQRAVGAGRSGRGHRLDRAVPVLRPGKLGDRASPGTSTAATSSSTELHAHMSTGYGSIGAATTATSPPPGPPPMPGTTCGPGP